MELEITTHSGGNDIIEVESYKAAELAKQINDEEIQAIAIGENVYSRIDIKNIMPVRNAK